MTDREKVIKGLEWALENTVDPFNDFRFVGYDGPIVLLNEPIVRDALALLKAQEPRLYTVEELKRGEHYYLELHLELTGDGIHYAEISSIDKWSDKLHGKFKAYDLIYDERGAAYMYEWSYGWTWRCWTSRPTDEQREAIPWLLVKNNAE